MPAIDMAGEDMRAAARHPAPPSLEPPGNPARTGGAADARGLCVGMRRQSSTRLDERMRLLASRQHGVVSRRQLLDAGFGPRAIDRRVESGVLRRLHRGVYLVGPLAPPLAGEMAATLVCGDHAWLSHPTAGHLWSLTPYLPKPRLIHVTVTRGDPRRRGVRAHRTRHLPKDETTTFKGIPITTPARTLLDLAPRLNPRQLERSLAEGIRTNRLRPSTLTPLLARHPGRPGVPALRRLLESGDPAFTRREAEERFLALVREAELPPPEANASLGPYEIDFLWRDERLAVEIDSWTFHGDRHAFEADRRRDADLASWGFRVIRVTWRQMEETPTAVVARLASAMCRSPSLRPSSRSWH
jgi:very-short-patch-repair endonuclease